MKSLTVKELSELVGVSQQTIYKKIKAGQLSRGSDKKIQFAEILRVFPDFNPKKEVEENIKHHSTDIKNVEIDALVITIKTLEKQLEAKDEQIFNLNKQVEKLLEMNNHLQTNALPDYSGKKTGSWWRFWG